MKILIAIALPCANTGSGALVSVQAKAYVKAGHEVHLILAEKNNDFEKIDGIQYHPVYFLSDKRVEGQQMHLNFNYPTFTTSANSVETFESISCKNLSDYEEAFQTTLARVIEEFKPDIIHAQHNWILSEQATHFHLPVLTTVHGTDLKAYIRMQEKLEKRDYASAEEAEKTAHYIQMAQQSAQRSDCLIAISKQQLQLIQTLFPQAKDKIVLIQNAYDDECFFHSKPVSDDTERIEKREMVLSLLTENFQKCSINKEKLLHSDKIVTFVGKFADFKGIDALINAIVLVLDNLQKKNISVHFLIIGDGILKESLVNMVRLNKLDETVTFCGMQSHRMIKMCHDISDVSVLSSRNEPFGLVILEGLACGHPVIVTNGGGAAELFEPLSKQAITSSIFKTDLGILTTPVPQRLTKDEEKEAIQFNALMSQYVFCEDQNRRKQILKQLPAESFEIAEEYMRLYEKSVRDMAESISLVLTGEVTFDPELIADYALKHYSVNAVKDKLLSLFEKVIRDVNAKSNKQG